MEHLNSALGAHVILVAMVRNHWVWGCFDGRSMSYMLQLINVNTRKILAKICLSKNVNIEISDHVAWLKYLIKQEEMLNFAHIVDA